MKVFVAGKDSLLDKVSDPEGLVRHDPGLADRFDALKDLRAIDDGSVYRGGEFRRVASIVAPLEDLAKVIEPEFLRDKRKFYRWLDAHPEYCTYDRRKRPAGRLEHGILAPGPLGGIDDGTELSAG